MTEHYWQRYLDQTALEPLNRKDQFWQSIRATYEKRSEPKHHL